MAIETEVERLVVRLVGDATAYQAMLQEAQASSKQLEQSITPAIESTAVLKEETAKLAAVEREREKTLAEGARLTVAMEDATETYLRQVGRLDELSAAGAISQETYNRALEARQDILLDAQGVAEGTNTIVLEQDQLFRGLGEGVADSAQAMSAFTGINYGAGRSLSITGRTISQVGLAFSVLNPQIGQSVMALGMMSSGAGTAVSTIYRMKGAVSTLIAVGTNPLALVAIPAVIAGMFLWKRHTESVKEAQEALKERTERLSAAMKVYAAGLEIFGKVPGMEPEEGEKGRAKEMAESQVKSTYKAWRVGQTELTKLMEDEQTKREEWQKTHPLVTMLGEEGQMRAREGREKAFQKVEAEGRKIIDAKAKAVGELSNAYSIAQGWAEKTKGPAAEEKVSKTIEEFADAQRKKISALNAKSEAEKELYDLGEKLRKQGLSSEMIDQRIGDARMLAIAAEDTRKQKELAKDLQKARDDAAKDAAKAQQTAEDEYLARYTEQMSRAESIMEQYLTPQEKYAKTMEELNRLRGVGILKQRDYDRAVAAAKKELAGVPKEVHTTMSLDTSGLQAGTAEAAAFIYQATRGVKDISGETQAAMTKVERAKGGWEIKGRETTAAEPWSIMGETTPIIPTPPHGAAQYGGVLPQKRDLEAERAAGLWNRPIPPIVTPEFPLTGPASLASEIDAGAKGSRLDAMEKYMKEIAEIARDKWKNKPTIELAPANLGSS